MSGYINKVRNETQNVLYAISGDMFRGSLIDTEYKGISTIEIMNLLSPDIVTLGNHEVDYGVAHLLFLEKCAKFPIINANMYIKTNHMRLFNSHKIFELDGMKILFIGVLTQEVLAQTKNDALIGSLLDVEEAAKEIGKICNYYKTEDIDFTVVLTHIGFEADKQLAAILDPNWGVDLIIGGHSHTLLEKPEVVAGIPIVQAACGTSQIGRFDIVVNTDTNSIDSYKWQLIPIDEEHCPRDEVLEDLIERYKEVTDQKYSRILTRISGVLTHPQRNKETTMGRLFADAFKEALGVDVMLMGSGSIRTETFGPIVSYKDLVEAFPYEDKVYRIYVTGAQLEHMLKFVLREEAYSDHTEFYQLSRGIRVEYDRETQKIVDLQLNGKKVLPDDQIKVGIQGFHFNNIKEHLDVTQDEVSEIKPPKIVSTTCQDIVEEYLVSQEFVPEPTDRRMIVHGWDPE